MAKYLLKSTEKQKLNESLANNIKTIGKGYQDFAKVTFCI